MKLTLSIEQQAGSETSVAENHSISSQGGRFNKVGSLTPLLCEVDLLNEKMGSIYF